MLYSSINWALHFLHCQSGIKLLPSSSTRIQQPPSMSSPLLYASTASPIGIPYKISNTLPPHFGHFSGLLLTFIGFISFSLCVVKFFSTTSKSEKIELFLCKAREQMQSILGVCEHFAIRRFVQKEPIRTILLHYSLEERFLGRADHKILQVEWLEVGHILGLALGKCLLGQASHTACRRYDINQRRTLQHLRTL